MNDVNLAEEVKLLVSKLAEVQEQIANVIVGQQQVVEQLMVGLLAGGHCLLEGVPGLGKTLLVRSLADAVHLNFQRIQFTPDLMPSDILGTEILEEDHSSGKRFFKFQKGPIFTHLLLADEINRTPPKTQAALLEAMQERSVSYAGTTYSLEQPFFVLATQNPVEQAGTYPLPEAQLDRFLLLINVDYPTEDEELQVLKLTTGSQSNSIKSVLTQDELLRLQQLVKEVAISDALVEYANRLIRQTRPQLTEVDAIKEWVQWGAGPRAGQALIMTAKARALLHGRYAVTREDFSALLLPVLQHRLLLNFHAEAEKKTVADVVAALQAHCPAPGEDK